MCSLARHESGHLPVAGGWLDQSATLLTAMQIVEDELAKHRDDQAKK